MPTPSLSNVRKEIGRVAYRVLPVPLRRRVWYLRFHHRRLRLRHPLEFCEKVQWRIVNDRRELIAVTCDKLKSKAVADGAGVRVPKTYWHGTDVQELAAVGLAEHWVLKPNHRCRLVHFGTGSPDIDSLRRLTKGWLRNAQTIDLGEWGYSQAEAALLVEETIGEPGTPPSDYKFFVFDGEPRVIQVDRDRFTAHRRRFYTTDWEPLDTRQGVATLDDIQPRPPFLTEMLSVARRLGAPYDFIRVDLYHESGEIIFGELTAYPGGGVRPFHPRDLDRLLGSHWHLPVLG